MLRGLKLIDTRFQKLSANILLLGDAAVGKTSIKKRYIGHGFRNSYLNTIGFDLIKKTIEFENQVALDAQIWDMGANRKPNRIVRKLLRKVSGALIIFDLTRYETFLKINHWIKELIESNPKRSLPILIIGNKTDLEKDRAIPREEVMKFVDFMSKEKKYKHIVIDYIETSAKTGENIQQTFETLTKGIVKMQTLVKG